LVSDAKWIIAVTIVMSLILYLPDQIRELYRVFADPDDRVARVATFLPICIIGVICWFAANQVGVASAARWGGSRTARVAALLLGPALGVLPVLAATAGQCSARPRGFNYADAALNVVGSPIENFDKLLTLGVGRGLESGATILAIYSFLSCITFLFLSWRLITWSTSLNDLFFSRPRFLFTIVLLTLGTTGAYTVFPLDLPRFLGVFGIIATFALFVAAFALYLSLLTLRHRFPFVPIIIGAAFLFSWFDLNDNHEIRILGADADPRASQRASAWQEFQKWHETRPDRRDYDEYPVYIVAAQGGGIYTAYQSALFLARLQDLCPGFKNHLFAISSVSGGSLGAATFVSLLNATGSPTPDQQTQASPVRGCPNIGHFSQNNMGLPLD
jgi:hypothetical protein